LNLASGKSARDLIFVIGMHRSGTSALARVLSLCGAALPRRLLPPNGGNPTGYWEPSEAMELNERFLRRQRSSWADPALRYRDALGDPADLARFDASSRDFVQSIGEFLANGFEPGEAVVLKEPRISALLPYWLAAAAEAGYRAKAIHIFRNPADVAASLAVQHGISFERASALWQKYNLLGEHDARPIPRAFVSYEALIEDWSSAIARCSSEIGVDLDAGAEARRMIETFLSPHLNHYSGRKIAWNHAQRPACEQMLLVHDALRRAAGGAADTAAFDALLASYCASRAAQKSWPEHETVTTAAAHYSADTARASAVM
jgi:hypothetical protein